MGYPLIVIAGQTASGKSALAMGLAERLPSEIICADSRTIYRGLDIGAAKPNDHDRSSVTHYMLDLLSLDETLSVSTFRAQVDVALTQIDAHQHWPLVVGGSKALVEAIIWDIASLPLDRNERMRLCSRSIERVQAQLVTAGVSLPLNHHSIESLVETLANNRPASYHARSDERASIVFALRPLSATQLHERISARLQMMLVDGLEAEVHALHTQRSAVSINSIGYDEWQPYFDDQCSQTSVITAIERKTVWYARQQQLWLETLAERVPVVWIERQPVGDQVECILSSLVERNWLGEADLEAGL